MPWSVVELYLKWPIFLLVLFRIGGLMLTAPIFSSSIFPTQVRILLALAIAAAVFPLVAIDAAVPVTMASALSGLVGELAVGLLIGFGLTLMFMSVQLAAEFMSHQCGMSMGSVYNPMLETSETVFSQLYYMTAVIGFFAVGGHRALLRAVVDSFSTLPPLGFKFTNGMMDLILSLTQIAFELAIRISGPTIIAMMMSLLILGFLSRTMPQLNILNVGFPLKLGIALIVMGFTVMSMEPLLLDAFDTGMAGVRTAFGLPAQA